jgi:hypothetical protein
MKRLLNSSAKVEWDSIFKLTAGNKIIYENSNDKGVTVENTATSKEICQEYNVPVTQCCKIRKYICLLLAGTTTLICLDTQKTTMKNISCPIFY